MIGLNRETHKWLQSLDLKVKNPKRSVLSVHQILFVEKIFAEIFITRDFANGLLVAQIFSRYFPNEIPVNLFYTGLNL